MKKLIVMYLGFLASLWYGLGCDVATPEEMPKPCAGYLVTSMCNATDQVSGLPMAGCHDDSLNWQSGCTYQAGVDVHSAETVTVLCVLRCQ